MFANIAEASEVAVIDADSQRIGAHWKLTKAADNVPLALDSEDGILFVACRTPGTLISLDQTTGKEIGSLAAAGGADDLFTNRAALEEEKGGDIVNAVLLGQLLLMIDVDLDDLEIL